MSLSRRGGTVPAKLVFSRIRVQLESKQTCMSYRVVLAALLGFVTCSLATRWILSLSLRERNWGTRGEAHHSHSAPTPRFGGAGLVAAFIIAEACIGLGDRGRFGATTLPSCAFIGALTMFGLGLWDDFRPLGPKRKLAGQILICAVLCCFGIGVRHLKLPLSSRVVELGVWGAPLTVFWLVAMTNLINFIDGMDGLAAGVSFMLMVLLCDIGRQTGSFELEASALAGALLGFLYFNLPPARIYMGDGGAYFIGFQIGLLALLNSHKGEVCAALGAPMLVLTLPILDTFLSILRRGLQGLPICRADRSHLHHRLLRNGLSCGQVLVFFYGLTLIFLVLGLGLYRAPGRWEPELLGLITLLMVARAGGFSLRWDWVAVREKIAAAWGTRRQVRCALRLARLLEVESRHRPSIDELWPELVSMAASLGFVSFRLALADETRQWEKPGYNSPVQCIRVDLPDPRFGRIELGAPLQDVGAGWPGSRVGRLQILGELFGEAWMNAATPYLSGAGCGLAFSSQNRRLYGRRQRQRLTPRFAQAVPDAIGRTTSSRA